MVVALGAGASALAVAVWAARFALAATRLPVAQPVVSTAAYVRSADTVRRGQTLSQILARSGVTGDALTGILAVTADAITPKLMRPGLIFSYRHRWDSDIPDRIDARLDRNRFLHIGREGNVWTSSVAMIPWNVELERVDGVIHTSLDATLQAAIGDTVLPAAERSRFVWDLADDVFAWQIDFSRDLAEGDKFSILFERTVSSLGDVRYGRVIAAHVNTHGVLNTAYVISDSIGANEYFDANGRSLRRTFKRNPVEYRITSGFSMARFHPILNITRPHLGTDYGAPYGAPIYATGDGVVRFAGPNGDDGIMVSIRHTQGIETRYAHMSKVEKGIRPGVRVTQGQCIGYVGATGLATGPHVHYEFIKNGKAMNARLVDLGTGTPLPADRRATFDQLRAHYDHLLEIPSAPQAASASGN
ncbi:MAG TPA: peptidoglycan DD-metalloendopeptidase family protein [Gemmatimonadales bacterium]